MENKYKESKKRYELSMKKVVVRFTKEDYKDLENDAQKYGIKVGKLIKLRSLKKEKHLLKEPKINVQTRADINKIGGNINQIARRINSGNFNENAIIKELKESVVILREMLNKIN